MNCGAFYEDLLRGGLNVLDKCPICLHGGMDNYVGSHAHSPHQSIESSRSTLSEAFEPVNIADFEVIARRVLDHKVYGYYSSGANDMITLRENKEAFTDLRILPRVLVDVTHVNLCTTILGDRIDFPICIAPSALQKMAHTDGELAVSRASTRLGTAMTLSTMSSTCLEDVAEAAPSGLRWFQLYVNTDRNIMHQLVRRASDAGYKALVVTVDAPMLGRREADIRNKFRVPDHITLGNFEDRDQNPSICSSSEEDVEQLLRAQHKTTFSQYFAGLIDKSVTWEDIRELKGITSMKIVVKGILTPEDATRAVDIGVDGIWVSNHGARQLDTSPATIVVLERIVRAVNGRAEVYLDGGITRGTDVFKALAIGARAVFVGRPVLWGLAHSGEDGVHRVISMLRDELLLAMQLAGVVDVKELTREKVCWSRELIVESKF